ncbi:hypothetical protein C8034_v005022 [Colletotrichum sidae]|uniref:Uncharacterized protein n=1 Tax=Colletotrichum sidae TaxID=1347389 RepID=A0A4R8T755_9PEZI|nr:hypothetical protein C8034_v005022 [Colletotrichum sidae]
MGASGPHGLARPLYGIVKRYMEKHQGKGHRFYLWHPDNIWHWRFDELLSATPLPNTFDAYSDDLHALVNVMKAARQALPEKHRSGVVFHLVIPAWYKIELAMPLHFPDELMPLRLVGPKSSGGKPSVIVNLPRSQEDLVFDGVANVLDPNGYTTKAEIAYGATVLVGGGWGVNGACMAAGAGLGALTGLGAVIMVPVWLGGFVTVGHCAMVTISEKVRDCLREEEARILGSDDRLPRTRPSPGPSQGER